MRFPVSMVMRQFLGSLELLLEIQQTGDIFFPTTSLSATFGSHNRPEAAAIVDRFMASHPDYPSKLRAKILRTIDDLQRAVKLMGVKRPPWRRAVGTT